MALTGISPVAINEQGAFRLAHAGRTTREQPLRRRAVRCGWALVLAGAVVVFPGRAAAQGPPVFVPSTNPVSDAVRAVLARDSKNLVGSAELMPAEKYTFQPTAAQMTFGKLVAHIVQTNVFICSGIGSSPSPMTPDELKGLSGSEAKDALVAALKTSFDYCTDSLAKVQDAVLGEEVSMFGRKTGQSRAAAMITIANDWADHYSTAAAYLRLNGILPPTAQPKK